MRNAIVLSVFMGAVVMAAACGSSTAPSGNNADSGVTSLQSTDVIVGTGAVAANGRIVTVHYTLWLYSTSAAGHKGTKIQSSRDSGQPLAFTLGVNQVIAGWDQGVPGMRVGGQRTLIVPPSLAYGSSPPAGSSIPANATLVFDIELLDVR